MRPALLTTAVVLLCLAYAVLRYNIVGPVPTDQIPLYVANKAISIGSLILIALAFAARRIPHASRLGWVRRDRRALGMTGLTLALLHTVLSVLLLNPTYFAKFFNDNGQLSAMAGISMLAGAIALVLLLSQGRVKAGADSDRDPAATPTATNARQTLRMLAVGVLTLTAAHVLFMGLPGWLAPGKWYGYLPPITLISFVVALGGLGIGMLPRK